MEGIRERTLLVLTYWILHLFSSVRGQGIEYCEGESFLAECASDEVIFMKSAEYGRMNLGKCLRIDYGNIGCRIDVLKYMDTRCSGRRKCEIRVSTIVDDIPERDQPCQKDLRNYLEASYTCVKVNTTGRGSCSQTGFLTLNSQHGFLASLVTETTNRGSIECPWVVTAKSGQRINFTLYDFGVAARPSFNSDVMICNNVYATVKESEILTSHKICGGSERIAHAYTSVTNTVELRMFQKNRDENNQDEYFYYMIRYDVIGCEDPKPPAGSYFERRGDSLQLHCNGSDVRRHLTCEDGAWKGDSLTCPPGGYGGSSLDDSVSVFWGYLTGTHEFSIIIITSVAVIIALAILIVGLICIKRKRDRISRQRLPERPSEDISSIYYSSGRKEMSSDLQSSRPTVTSLDQYPSQENDYFRTWQLQRHAQPGGIMVTQASHGYPMSYPTGHAQTLPHDTAGTKYTFQPVEHIYESPKFERRDLHYHELDPGAVSKIQMDTAGRYST